MMKTVVFLKSGFDVERFRKKLLCKKKYKTLLETYFSDLPEIEDQNSPKFWDEKFATETESDLFPMSTDRNRIVGSLIQPNTKVLNIGAGMGYLEEVVFNTIGEHIDWTGTDITNQTLEKLKTNFPKYHFVKSKIEELPFERDTFDIVCLLEVLEHISPRHTFGVLKKIHTVLKPGGTAIISVPVNEGLEMMPNNPNSHLRVYSKELLSFEAKISGFKIKRIIALTAFPNWYFVKKIINSIFNLRKPNNYIFILEKK